MSPPDKSVEHLLNALKERAKELNCLYEIEELFNKPDATLESIFKGIVRAIPSGWQYSSICQARILYGDAEYVSEGFQQTAWVQSADIIMQDEVVGKIEVFYMHETPFADEGPFLKEERRLISAIAPRLARRILHEKLKLIFADKEAEEQEEGEWSVILNLLKRTDPKLLIRITRKMLNFLSWSGVEAAAKILERFNPASMNNTIDLLQDANRPSKRRATEDFIQMSNEVFSVAEKHLGSKEVLDTIQKWVVEDRTNFFVKILEDTRSSLSEITNALERFHHLVPHGLDLPASREKGIRISLIRRLLNEDSHFINTAQKFIRIDDFYDVLHHIISPAGSHGKIGGKGAGLFLAAHILSSFAKENEQFGKIKTPKTWYITSDGILNFINHNDLEEIIEQKYEDIGQVRREYPYVVHVFKNSTLPPEIVNGLSVALDDFGDSPLIVRSSSLLEDRIGTSFAGKYKSLFIANQGTKRERLLALMDAITEVYASTFSPDPIGYRIEHGMIDFHEEMGILIQEVVGKKVGDYFIPSFAGVAFANNEFRWSHRIKREDGLLRMVPGLGTRAVDRISDDYPVLIAPGQPNLRVNVTLDEQVHYAPKKIDVINLKTNSFETMELKQLLREAGDEYPMIQKLVSVLQDDRFDDSPLHGIDFEIDHIVMTFDNLVRKTNFISQIKTLITTLQNALGIPVDIEFAHDGTDLYLLQCRSQSSSVTAQAAVIPRDIPKENILFSANRYVTNGIVSGITHIVYVDPQKYGELRSHHDLLAVGRAISKLNQLLPKRQFILMGPGRWGSRGDIKLGVNVTYSDINNTAMLIEIARKKKGYMPELSFGTHFFQDLVEASIRYLPLYPDDASVVFNEAFFISANNIFEELLPEFAKLASVIRVIEVAKEEKNHALEILMNGERDEAVGVLTRNLK